MRWILVSIVLVVLGVPAAAEARHVGYIGIHPVPKASGGGTCYVEGPHVHVYAADPLQYRDHDGLQFFVGDPVAYGYDGPGHAYKGHHPIHVHVVTGVGAPDVEFCYLDEPHYHAFAPHGPDFVLEGGAYFYVGAPPKVYVEARPRLRKINAVYEPLAYARPVVTVDAPAGWIGARVVVSPRARVRVARPVVRIPAPAIHLEIGVGAPVIIHEHRHRYHRHHHHEHKKHKKWKKHRRRRW